MVPKTYRFKVVPAIHRPIIEERKKEKEKEKKKGMYSSVREYELLDLQHVLVVMLHLRSNKLRWMKRYHQVVNVTIL
ncbi:uncharacterized protein HKW66_Vig0249980 [Vigna angularis]|uniref:Uncharacterized protein n=1 Tax=Phaseolus angularis TaxID=3914 RepID=A0A8T0KU34_PHAAN|nr:uncharacterized protein HKW66_Vig0249980 [Vigna angularis]